VPYPVSISCGNNLFGESKQFVQEELIVLPFRDIAGQMHDEARVSSAIFEDQGRQIHPHLTAGTNFNFHVKVGDPAVFCCCCSGIKLTGAKFDAEAAVTLQKSMTRSANRLRG
jgi:hypothetical protein